MSDKKIQFIYSLLLIAYIITVVINQPLWSISVAILLAGFFIANVLEDIRKKLP